MHLSSLGSRGAHLNPCSRDGSSKRVAGQTGQASVKRRAGVSKDSMWSKCQGEEVRTDHRGAWEVLSAGPWLWVEWEPFQGLNL